KEQITAIAKLGQGSFRDTLSLLDQVLSYTADNQVTEHVLAQSLGVVRQQLVEQLCASLLNGDDKYVHQLAKQALRENIALKALASAILVCFFMTIEHLEDQAWLDSRAELGEAISSVTNAELFWVYENIARETTWLLNSMAGEQAFLVLLKKMTLRRSLL